MPDKVAELYADFRVNFQKATLDVLNTTLGELRLGTLAEIASLAGLAKMLFNTGEQALKTATHLHMLGNVYGINAQQLQKMERAGLAANVSVDKMEGAVMSLQQNLAALNLGRASDAFLQAAGFFGVKVGPGSSQDDLMNQLLKRVPEFVKTKGAMGRSMASLLLGDMGIDPEMLQYFMGGQKSKAGPTVDDPTIAALTKTSEAMSVAAFDIRNLSTNAIAPLVDILGPLAADLHVIAAAAGGVANLAHPVQTAKGVWEYLKGKGHDALHYETTAQQKYNSAMALAIRRHISSPVTSSTSAVVNAAAVAAAGRPQASGDFSSETNIHIRGNADTGTVREMKAALKDRDARTRAAHAGAANYFNPLEAGQSPKN